MPCTPATVAAAGEVEAAAAQKAGDGERTDDAVEAPTRTVVARPQPAAGGDGSNATAADCSTPARGCYRYGQKGHRIADCTEKLLICSRCNGRGHTTQCLPTSNEEPALAVTSEVWARADDGDDGTVQASAFKAEETVECDDVVSRMGDGGLP